MLKSEIIEKPSTIGSFPLLAKYIAKANVPFIVLFVTEEKGTVLYSDNPDWACGEIHDKFVSVCDEKYWYILPTGTKIEITVQ